MRVLFGGSFDPVHKAHVEMVRYVSSLCEEVLVVPSFISPFKSSSGAVASHRLKMCEVAFGSIPSVSVLDIEVLKGEINYTIDTLKAMKQCYGGEFALLIGSDCLPDFDKWRGFLDIISLAEIWIIERKGYSLDTEVLERHGALFKILPFSPAGVSSTDIRENLCDLNEPVLQYIKAHSLYGYAEIYKSDIREKLSDKRYYHSLCVADEARRLAGVYRADGDKALTAGLLHDIMKDTPVNIQLKLLSDFGIIFEYSNKKLVHSYSGSVYVKHVLGVEDDEIFDAIRYHTTAKADMPLFSKILFMADFTSADRNYEGVDDLRVLIDEDLDKAYRGALEFTVRDLREKELPIHNDTLNALKGLGVE